MKQLNTIRKGVIGAGIVSAVFGLIIVIIAIVLRTADHVQDRFCLLEHHDQSNTYCRLQRNVAIVVILGGLAQIAVGIATVVLAYMFGRISLLVFGTGHALLVVPFFIGFSLMLITSHYRPEYGKGTGAGKVLYAFAFIDALLCFLLCVASVPLDFIWRYFVKDDAEPSKGKDDEAPSGGNSARTSLAPSIKSSAAPTPTEKKKKKSSTGKKSSKASIAPGRAKSASLSAKASRTSIQSGKKAKEKKEAKDKDAKDGKDAKKASEAPQPKKASEAPPAKKK